MVFKCTPYRLLVLFPIWWPSQADQRTQCQLAHPCPSFLGVGRGSWANGMQRTKMACLRSGNTLSARLQSTEAWQQDAGQAWTPQGPWNASLIRRCSFVLSILRLPHIFICSIVSLPCPAFVCFLLPHLTKSNLRFIWLLGSKLSWWKTKSENRDRNLKAGTEWRTWKNTTCWHILHRLLNLIFYTNHDSLPDQVGPCLQNVEPSYKSLMKKVSMHICLHTNLTEVISQLKSFSRDSSMCHIDKN